MRATRQGGPWAPNLSVCRLVRRNPLEGVREEPLRVPEVVGLLQPQPETWAIPAELAETDCHLRSDRGPAREDAMKGLAGHPELSRRLRHREPESRQHVLAEDLAGMDRGDWTGRRTRYSLGMALT